MPSEATKSQPSKRKRTGDKDSMTKMSIDTSTASMANLAERIINAQEKCAREKKMAAEAEERAAREKRLAAEAEEKAAREKKLVLDTVAAMVGKGIHVENVLQHLLDELKRHEDNMDNQGGRDPMTDRTNTFTIPQNQNMNSFATPRRPMGMPSSNVAWPSPVSPMNGQRFEQGGYSGNSANSGFDSYSHQQYGFDGGYTRYDMSRSEYQEQEMSLDQDRSPYMGTILQ
ncbi:hypothetical protein V5O48_005852 [Marasmius crinis-equi]|uniref:Uncharacterized protein n=1 Tax=Marasmius crinis-equi TaxID=585013 RepID=A0ABR3FL60_9AGAR